MVYQPCELPEDDDDGSSLLCVMPEVLLPDDLMEQLEDREMEAIDDVDEGPGVASYTSTDGLTSVIIYVGLQLDGVRTYASISNFDPSIKMRFALEPIVFCSPNISFTPDYDTTIIIQVNTGDI